jgi:hypothetical protein
MQKLMFPCVSAFPIFSEASHHVPFFLTHAPAALDIIMIIDRKKRRNTQKFRNKHNRSSLSKVNTLIPYEQNFLSITREYTG